MGTSICPHGTQLDSGDDQRLRCLLLGQATYGSRTSSSACHATVQLVGVLLRGHALVIGGEAQVRVIDDDLSVVGQALDHLERLALALRPEIQTLRDIDRADLQADARDVLVLDSASNGLGVDFAPRRRHVQHSLRRDFRYFRKFK